jgi:hypothetical protein
MKKKKKNSNKEEIVVDFSITRWATLFGMAIFFLCLPYQRALFNSFTYDFELPIYEAQLFVFSLFLVALAYIARYLKYDSFEFVFGVGMLLMPMIYWISSFQAVAYHNAVLMVFVYGLYTVFFLTAISMVTTRASLIAAELLVFLAGYAITFVGLLAATGQVSIKDSIWLSSGTYRLTSIFQYSNTYAGFLLAYFLSAIFAIVNAKRTLTACLHALMLVPIWLSFMLTYSRGALVLVPVLVLVILLFLRADKQLAYLCVLAGSVGVTFVILNGYTENYIGIARRVMPKSDNELPYILPVRDPAVVKAWLMLAAASFAVALIVWAIRAAQPWLERRLAGWNERAWSSFLLPAMVVAAGAAASVLLFGTGIASRILPESIAERIANINFRQHSVLERLTFYKDALKVASDYPLLGAGGGAWSALYEQYQNNPYISRQAHSFFFQTLVEVGWLGLLILVVLIAGIYLYYLHYYWRQRKEQPRHFVFFILTFSILAHSMFDFDMSYVYIGALVFFSLGVLGAVYRDKWTLTRLSVMNQPRWRFVLPSLLAVMSVVMIVQVFKEYAAVHHYRKSLDMAVREQRPLNEIIVPLNLAIASSPAHPEYVYTKIDWLSQAFQQTLDRSYAEQTKQLINQIISFESHDRRIILAKYRNHKDMQEYKEAIDALEEGISKFQWDIKFYEAAIMEYAVNGRNVRDTDPVTAENYWNRGLELYGEVLRRMDMLKNLPEEQLQGRSFDITPFMRQAVGQIYYARRQYEDAFSILQPLSKEDLSDQYIRLGIRYYLASLHKMGKSDERLMKRLLDADAKEKRELEALLEQSS